MAVQASLSKDDEFPKMPFKRLIQRLHVVCTTLLANASGAVVGLALPLSMILLTLPAPSQASWWDQLGTEAASRPPTDWSIIVAHTLDWNPNVREARFKQASAEADIQLAKANDLPRLDADAATQYRLSDGTLEESFNLRVLQKLFDFGKTSAQLELARLKVKERQHEADSLLEDLILDTLTALIDVQTQTRIIQTRTQQLGDMQSLHRLATRLEQQGIKGQGDVLEALSQIQVARSAIIEARKAKQLALNDLKALTGMRLDALEDTAFPPALAHQCDTPLNEQPTHPDILTEMARLQQANARLDQSRADRLPTISLAPTLSYSPSSPLPDQDKVDVNLSLDIDTSLYQGGASLARIRTDASRMTGAQARIDTRTLEIRRALDDAKASLQSSRAIEESLDARLNALKATKAFYLRQYTALGERTLTELGTQTQRYFDAQVRRHQTRQQIRLDSLDCLHAVGRLRTLFDTDIDTAGLGAS